MITIYHNGECSKSMGALEILQQKGLTHEIRYYLIEPPTRQELKDVLQKLGLAATDIVRKKEAKFLAEFDGRQFSDEEWINILITYPELIERPIVVNGEKAIIARPPEKILEILPE